MESQDILVQANAIGITLQTRPNSAQLLVMSYQDWVARMLPKFYLLSNHSLISIENLAATIEVWAEFLETRIPLADLDEAANRALNAHKRGFPLTATDIWQAYTEMPDYLAKKEAERMEAIAREIMGK